MGDKLNTNFGAHCFFALMGVTVSLRSDVSLSSKLLPSPVKLCRHLWLSQARCVQSILSVGCNKASALKKFIRQMRYHNRQSEQKRPVGQTGRDTWPDPMEPHEY